MSKSKKFREEAFPFLKDPESLLLLGGPATAIPALGPKRFKDELLRVLNEDQTQDFSDFEEFF